MDIVYKDNKEDEITELKKIECVVKENFFFRNLTDRN